MKVKKVGDIPKVKVSDIIKEEVKVIKEDQKIINSERNLNIPKEEIILTDTTGAESSSNQMYYILGVIVFVLTCFVIIYFVFFGKNNIDEAIINPKTGIIKEIPEDTIRKEKHINNKSFKDTLIALNKITRQYSNGYFEILYNQYQTKRVKIPLNEITDIVNNIKNYRFKYKVIPSGEVGEKEDYNEYIINIISNKEILLKNKYSISDVEYESILNLTLREEAKRSECFAKVKNKREILDIELFDLNSDGQDEYIVWCSNSSCFVYNQCQDVFILEKVGNSLIKLYENCAEGIEISNKISNGYFILEESGIAGRGRNEPEEVITNYKFIGGKYVEAGTRHKKIIID